MSTNPLRPGVNIIYVVSLNRGLLGNGQKYTKYTRKEHKAFIWKERVGSDETEISSDIFVAVKMIAKKTCSDLTKDASYEGRKRKCRIEK